MSAIDTLCSAPLDAVHVDHRLPGRGLGSAEIVPMVETVLRAAMDRLDAEAAAAHAEASAVIAAAVRRSADLVVSLAAGRGSAPAPPAPVPFGPSRLPDPGGEELGPEVGVRTAAQVYDLFWSEIPSDQPIRERLRRWAQRPPL